MYINHAAAVEIEHQFSLNTIAVKKLNLRLVRASEYLQRFWLKIQYKSEKTNIIPDVLFRLLSSNNVHKWLASREYQPESDESILKALQANVSTATYAETLMKVSLELQQRLKNSYAKESRWGWILKMLNDNNTLGLNAAKLPYELKNGLVYYKDIEKRPCLCIPHSLHNEVFKLAHDEIRHSEYTWHEFLNKTLKKWMNNKKSIFSDYKKFKGELWRAFRIVDEKWAAERQLHILKMNKSAVKYAAEFQWIVALTDWDDDTLVLQYYWELNETIKDEIVRMNWLEELQNMIDTFINIDSCQWEWWMKHTEHYTSKVWRRHYILREGDSMNLDVIEKHCEQQPWVKQERCMSKLYKSQLWWAETHKCYNCEKLRHLVRTCKKPQQERKEVAAMNTHIVHDTLSWTVCYDDMCWTHMSSKDKAEWYSQKLKKRQNGYDMTD